MSAFWRFSRHLLRRRAPLAAALVFAFISAAGLGVGLASIAPLLGIILKEDKNLRVEAARVNAEHLGAVIPTELIEMLPVDRFAGVAVLLAALAVLTLIGATASFFHEYIATALAARSAAQVRADCFRAAVLLPLTTVVRRGPAEYVSRIVRDSIELQRGFMVLSSRAVAQVSKGIAAFLAAIVIDWRLTLVALVVAPALAVVLRKLGKRIRRGTRGALEAQESLLRTATESLQGLRAVKANGSERIVRGRFRRANRAALRGELRVRTARALSGPIVETLAILVISGLALFAAREIIEGRLEFERFVLALTALAVAGASFKPLAGFINEVQAAGPPAQRLAEIIDAAPEPRTRGLPRLPRHSRSIAIEGVRLRYPGAVEEALRGLSLSIAHGETVALVGPNGSGKTTLASLLPRLLVPQSGRILIDGVDIASVDLHSLRRQIGVVTQETVLFAGTIEENIRFGIVGATRDDVVAAVERAHAAEFIRQLPRGLDEPVAEQGLSLSGGQRQRLAIARALLRDPAILILDEATSQIDSESERQIQQAIAEIREGRTTILVAHRPSTMQSADRIVVLVEGAVIDSGTHAALLGRCEVYRRLAAEPVAV